MTELEKLKEENRRLKKELQAYKDSSWDEEPKKGTIGWAIEHNNGFQSGW